MRKLSQRKRIIRWVMFDSHLIFCYAYIQIHALEWGIKQDMVHMMSNILFICLSFSNYSTVDHEWSAKSQGSLVILLLSHPHSHSLPILHHIFFGWIVFQQQVGRGSMTTSTRDRFHAQLTVTTDAEEEVQSEENKKTGHEYHVSLTIPWHFFAAKQTDLKMDSNRRQKEKDAKQKTTRQMKRFTTRTRMSVREMFDDRVGSASQRNKTFQKERQLQRRQKERKKASLHPCCDCQSCHAFLPFSGQKQRQDCFRIKVFNGNLSTATQHTCREKQREVERNAERNWLSKLKTQWYAI